MNNVFAGIEVKDLFFEDHVLQQERDVATPLHDSFFASFPNQDRFLVINYLNSRHKPNIS